MISSEDFRITTTSNFHFIQENFIKAKKALNLEKKTGRVDPNRIKGVGLEGGSRTGKTWDTCIFMCHYASSYTGKIITVARDYHVNITKTFYQTLKKVWINKFKFPAKHFNKNATDIEFEGNLIRFMGAYDAMAVHGLESDLLIVNEAMGVDKDTLDQFEQRCNEFYIIDYNPSEPQSHLYEKEKDPSYRLHKTVIFDNIYAPPNPKAKILGYAHPEVQDEHIAVKAGYSAEDWERLKQRNVLLGTAHKYNWEVYGLGKRGKSEDVIFKEWSEYEQEPPDSEVDWCHVGGDFGFVANMTAAVRVKKRGNCLYLKQLIYETGMLNPDIAQRMKDLGEDKNRSIWDKAELKSIYELRNLNVDAWYSDKGPGSVSFGIQKMKQFHIFLHKDSEHLKEEFTEYKWAKHKNGEYKLNSFGKRIPVDKKNHLIDGARYVLLFYYWEIAQE